MLLRMRMTPSLLRGVLLLGLAPALAGAEWVDVAPLVEAARQQDWAQVRALLDQGEDASVAEADGGTALHWASYWDDVESAGLLLRSGGNVNAVNDLGATALWNASLNGSRSMVSQLLEAGADPNLPLISGETPVMTAARTGEPGILGQLLRAGGDPNVTATRGQTALMWAVSQGHTDAAVVLLEHGADVYARSDTWSQVMAVSPHADRANQQVVPHGGNTALLFAARIGNLSAARLLVAAGADVNDTDAWGVSATVVAAFSGFSGLAEFLLDSGADPNLSEAGFSAVHVAIMSRDEGLVRTLLARGADPNARLETWTPHRRSSRDRFLHPSLVGATPFWIAARFSQPGVMRLLAEHGADPRFVHHADYVGSAGAFGAARRVESTTALMAAVGMGGPRRMRAFVPLDPAELGPSALESVELAVELGADVDATDLEGRSALDAAGFPSIVEFLSTHGAAR